MLGGRSLADRRPALRVQHLDPLALADRVVTENRHAVLRQQETDPLIRGFRLAARRVAARNQHAGYPRRGVW